MIIYGIKKIDMAKISFVDILAITFFTLSETIRIKYF